MHWTRMQKKIEDKKNTQQYSETMTISFILTKCVNAKFHSVFFLVKSLLTNQAIDRRRP